MLLYKLITMHNIGYTMHSDAYQCCNSSTSGQAVVLECIQRQDPCKYHRMTPAAFAYAKPLYFLFTLSLFSVFEIGIILFRRRLWTHTGRIQSYTVSYVCCQHTSRGRWPHVRMKGGIPSPSSTGRYLYE